MNDPSLSEQPAPMLGMKQAVWLGVALLAGLGLTLGMTVFDRSRRTQIEQMSETTAVGDRALFTIPTNPPEPHPVVVTVQGRAWRLASLEKRELRETHMRRAGRDEAAGLWLYRFEGDSRRVDDAGKAVPAGGCYLKIGRDEFVELE